MHTDLDKNPISLLPKDIIWLGNKMYVTSLVYANSNWTSYRLMLIKTLTRTCLVKMDKLN